MCLSVVLFGFGPTLFIDYESPITTMIRRHCVNAHVVYGDDLQIYIVFKCDKVDDGTLLIQLRSTLRRYDNALDGSEIS